MYYSNNGVPTPTAEIAINKSRLKKYGKKSKVPTYYLQRGQEFQIELFNPTKDNVLAKIALNGKLIAQGGLVLKPGQRVFLERYLDVAKKFKFDTYEVANTSEARKAIEDNGDFKVEFYREQNYNPITIYSNSTGTWNTGGRDIIGGTITTNNTNFNDTLSRSASLDSIPIATASAANYNSDIEFEQNQEKSSLKSILRSKKSIETGRVEQGSRSDQSFEIVSMDWEYLPFHTIEYKLLPLSQKVNSVEDVSVKRYCSSCGTKQKPNFKFCPSCGAKV